jgi:hypothetical protein
MKRQTVLFTIALLALFLSAAFPAGASSLAAERPSQPSGVSAPLAQVINTLPEGFHESHFEGSQNQFSCFAVGWAADPDDRSADLNIRVFSDNIEVAQTVANLFRQDLYDAGVCQDGTCNFSVDLWGLIAPGVDHSITVQAQDAQTGEWVDLSTTPRTLNCFEENVAPEGYHDAV